MDLQKFKSIKNTKMIASLVLLVFGITFVVLPDEFIKTLALVLALTFALAGVIEIIAQLTHEKKGISEVLMIIFSAVVTVVGVVFAFKHIMFADILSYVFGGVAVIVALLNVFHSLRYAKKCVSKWFVSAIAAGIAGILGAVVIIMSMNDASRRLVAVFIGISMLLITASQMWNFFSMNKKVLVTKDEKGKKLPETKEVKAIED